MMELALGRFRERVRREKIDGRPRLSHCRRQPDKPQIFFLLQKATCLCFKPRRNDHFAKNFPDRFGQRLIDRSIANDNSAEGRLFIS